MLCNLRTHSFQFKPVFAVFTNGKPFSTDYKPASRKSKNNAIIYHKPRDVGADVKRLQKQVLRSIKHMMENENIDVSFENETLLFHTSRGKYWLYPDYANKEAVFMSWNTPKTTYSYYPEENVWLANKSLSGDTHDFREMFTRDIVKYHIGCPNFNFPDCNLPEYYLYPRDDEEEEEEEVKLLGR